MWCSKEQVWHSSEELFTERFPVDIEEIHIYSEISTKPNKST